MGLAELPTSLTEDEGRDHSTTGSPRMCKGFMYVSVQLLSRELDHPTTLGIRHRMRHSV